MFAPKKGPHLTSLHPDRFKKLSPYTSIPVHQYASMLSPMYQCASMPVCSPRDPFRPLSASAAALFGRSSSQAVKQQSSSHWNLAAKAGGVEAVMASQWWSTLGKVLGQLETVFLWGSRSWGLVGVTCSPMLKTWQGLVGRLWHRHGEQANDKPWKETWNWETWQWTWQLWSSFSAFLLTSTLTEAKVTRDHGSGGAADEDVMGDSIDDTDDIRNQWHWVLMEMALSIPRSHIDWRAHSQKIRRLQ